MTFRDKSVEVEQIKIVISWIGGAKKFCPDKSLTLFQWLVVICENVAFEKVDWIACLF